MKKNLLFLAALFMTMLFSVNVNAAEVDKTAAVKTDVAAWGGGTCATQYAPAITTADGRTSNMAEKYEGTVETTGVLLSQTVTGLENGTYKVVLYANAFFTSGRGFESTMADGATDVAYVFAKVGDVELTAPITAAITTATEANGEYTIEGIEVTDGTLTLGLAKSQAGTNWHTINIKSLALIVDNYPAYEAALAAANEAVTKKMDAAVKEELAAVIAANKDLTAESADADLIAATEALNAAVFAANSSVALYASNETAINAQIELVNATNVYGDGFETFKAAAEAYLASWEAGTLTETVVNPNAATAWRSSTAYNFLLTPWTIGGTAANNFDAALYINTWSTEGDTDGTNFKVPFFEYWTGDANSLGANTIQATKIGLEPRSIYKVTAWTRVRIKNGATTPTGITFNAGGASVDACAGTQVGSSQFYLAEISVLGVTDANGTLNINYEVAADNNISWLSFKNVKVEEYSVYAPSNLDFSAGTPAAVGICTYAKDIAANGTALSQMQAVPGWTIVENGDARAAGIFTYGSDVWNGGSGYNVPATNPAGEATGNALGFVAVWSATGQYTQKITLPAGSYTITIPVYNAKGGTTVPTKSLIGFIAEDGTEYLAPAKAYTVDTWTTETITFTLEEETSGVLSLGYQAPNSGSGGNQHLFFDAVNITPLDNAFYLTPTILKAESIDQTILSEEVAAALNTAIATAKAVDTTDDAAVAAAISALQTATQAAYDEEDAIIALNAAKEAARAELASYKEYSENSTPNEESFKTAYDQAVADAEAAVEAAETIAAVEAALEPVEAARQTYVMNAYPANGFAFDMTFLVKNADASAATEGWTTEGTVGKNSGQHWSGVGANQYIEPCNWGATGWTSSFNQTVIVPAGKYTVQAAGRASANVTLKLVAGDKTAIYESLADNGGTIATDGSVHYDIATAVAEGYSFAKNNAGYGWTYATIEKVVVAPEQGITIGATATTANQHEWASIDDFKLFLTDVYVAPSEVTATPASGDTVNTYSTKYIAVTFTGANVVEANAECADPIYVYSEDGQIAASWSTSGRMSNVSLGISENTVIITGMNWGEEAPLFSGLESGTYKVVIPEGMFIVGADSATATVSGVAELTYYVEKFVLEEATVIAVPGNGTVVGALPVINMTFDDFGIVSPSWTCADSIVVKKDGEVYAKVAVQSLSAQPDYAWNQWDVNLGLTEVGNYTIEFPAGALEEPQYMIPFPAFTLAYTVVGYQDVTADPADGSTVDTNLKSIAVTFNDVTTVAVNTETYEPVYIYDENGQYAGLIRGFYADVEGNVATVKNSVWDGDVAIFNTAGTYTIEFPAGQFYLNEDSVASKVIKLTYVVEEPAPAPLNITVTPESGSTVESLDRITVVFNDYEDIGWNYEFCTEKVIINKDGDFYKEGNGDNGLTEQPGDWNSFDIVAGLTEPGTYEIIVPNGYFKDNSDWSFPNPGLAGFTLTYTIAGAPANENEVVYEVERVAGLGYTADVVTVDMAAICEKLGVASIDEATVWGINASTMEWVTNPMASSVDGWMNNQGDYASWGEGYICYKYMADGNFQLCTHPSNEPTVGTVFNAYYGFTTATDTVVVKTVINIVEAPKVELETVKTITVNTTAEALTAYANTPATFDVTEVCEALGVTDLSAVETYIVNTTTGEFVANTTDGWRDANGDAAVWGSGEGMVCVKLSDPTTGSFDYIAAIDATIQIGTVYTAKWAIAANGKAVVLEVVIEFVTPVGINGIEADVVKTEYFSVNGAALNAPAKGVNIVKQTLANGKVVTSKVYVK